MKQIICKNMKKMLSCIVALSIIACLGVLTSCSSNDNPSSGDTISEKADLVVYGKIFTAEGNQIAEAFAVKDGKYIGLYWQGTCNARLRQRTRTLLDG